MMRVLGLLIENKKQCFIGGLGALIIVAALAMVNPFGSAYAVVHNHCMCGSSDSCGEGHDATQVWTPWDNSSELPTEAGYYYLTTDVVASSWGSDSYFTYGVISNDISICLNGHVVKAPYIAITGGHKLCITDCNKSVNHYFSYHPNSSWELNDTADAGLKTTAITVDEITDQTSDGQLIKIAGGCIVCAAGAKCAGGAAYIMDTSSLVLNEVSVVGGTYSGCQAGSIILVDSSGDDSSVGLSMNNVSFFGCNSTDNGIIFGDDDSSLVLNDCEFQYCEAHGGIIETDEAEFTAVNLTMKHNENYAEWIYAVVYIDGGETNLSGLVLQHNGTCGLYIDEYSCVTISNVDIQYNKRGGIVYKANDGLCSGKWIVKNNTDDGVACDVVLENALYAANGFSSDSEIGIYTDDTTVIPLTVMKSSLGDFSSVFFSDSDRYRIQYFEDGSVKIADRIKQQPAFENKFTVDVDLTGLTNPEVAYQWYQVEYSLLEKADSSKYMVGGGALTGSSLQKTDTMAYILFDSNLVKDGDKITFTCSDDAVLDQIAAYSGYGSLTRNGNNFTYTIKDSGEGLYFVLNDGAKYTISDIKLPSGSALPGNTAAKLVNGEEGKIYYCVVTINGDKAMSEQFAYVPVPEDDPIVDPVDDPTDAPKTGDKSPIGIIVVALMGAAMVAFFARRKTA